MTDAEKEQRKAERAAQLAAEAKIKREAKENEYHAQIVAKLDAKRAPQDTYNLFEALHRMALGGRLDEGLRNIHMRQEGLR